MLEKLKNKFSRWRQSRLKASGARNGDVVFYPDWLFDRLRPYNYCGLPASMTLFMPELCNSKCHDMALLMSMAFEDCKLVVADIETLRINHGVGNSRHSFVEIGGIDPCGTGKKGDWIADTSAGLLFRKDLYYKIEKPKIHKVHSKQECLNFTMTQEMLATDFEESKSSLPLMLPFIEKIVANSTHPAGALYGDKVKKEIARFKQAINYDGIVAELDKEIQMSLANPREYDKKLGIVRDRGFNEVSRNGVPNKYYNIKPEEVESIREEEEQQIRRKATMRLSQIKQNPTKNFYQLPPIEQ